jgi:adenine phosphoribosyltransferase
VTSAAAEPGVVPVDELVASLTVDVPDFPAPGVVFRDLTPVFADAEAFRRVVDGLAGSAQVDPRAGALSGPAGQSGGPGFDVVTGVVPVRKAGKLPRERVSAEYALEYGTATLELHTDSVRPGQRVLLVDDVLATGGTLEAAVALVERLGGIVTGVSVVVELVALGGRQRVAPHPVHALWTA